ncbi:MAG: sugar ABC transporter permease [Treponema sp.]|jgi:ABC-type sugar transport system permease subunit|nr:sugar ABC transporter permease [Treponema sp.]
MNLYGARKRETGIVTAFFSLPAVVLLLVYIYYSVGYAFFLSFHEWNGIAPVKDFVGFMNWKELLRDNAFIEAFKHNIYIVVWSLVVQQPIAMALAFMLTRMGRKSTPLKVIYYLPSLFSTASVGVLFSYIYSPRDGIFTAMASGIASVMQGAPVRVTVDMFQVGTSLLSVFSVISWTAIPFYILFYMAAMSGISTDIYEAAIIDGASLRQYFFRIMLPSLKFSIQTACTLSIIGSLKYFDLIYIITDGGPSFSSELMATYMFRQTFRFRQMGYGSATAGGLFIIVVVFSLLVLFISNKILKENEE